MLLVISESTPPRIKLDTLCSHTDLFYFTLSLRGFQLLEVSTFLSCRGLLPILIPHSHSPFTQLIRRLDNFIFKMYLAADVTDVLIWIPAISIFFNLDSNVLLTHLLASTLGPSPVCLGLCSLSNPSEELLQARPPLRGLILTKVFWKSLWVHRVPFSSGFTQCNNLTASLCYTSISSLVSDARS